ncbi:MULTISPECIES: glycosyltransferase family 4 protein [unclassified Rhodococcus (in: high G+C Gram-positive bacteria)]|uniref:glycosyltransferase family 4 protein n=1 Tax=unclassified Rhodococcus (in: high G+C Gram-positive bacteria) TaxID=192944 RepID=UPI0004833DE6|nr:MULTISPECIES: glycosyltransferase family 4 protein [unclassified Rhodococcus (in: high G+C Gram-positive bacteria)]
MTGAEWFADSPGGLNRYFTDLYVALSALDGVSASASAFGDSDLSDGHHGTSSWGPSTGSTLSRVWSALSADRGLPRNTVIDRHFSLFGRPTVGLRGAHPSVAHFHGPWAAESAMSGESDLVVRAKYWVERLRFLDVRRFIVLSGHSARILTEDYAVDPAAITIIPPGVDLDRFAVTPAPSNARPTVLCVRRLERRMGIDRLVAAWPAVVADHPDAQLVVVGTGTEEAALRSQAAESTAGDSIVFTGRTSDERLAALYAEATVSVVPTLSLEGFGLIALESCASGRAPVVTDCGGLPDAVAGLDPSLVVPAGDVDALAHRLSTALSGDVPSAAACRAHAESFSWESSARRHVDVYRELVHR